MFILAGKPPQLTADFQEGPAVVWSPSILCRHFFPTIFEKPPHVLDIEIAGAIVVLRMKLDTLKYTPIRVHSLYSPPHQPKTVYIARLVALR